ncbi:MAG: hypothetical protein PHD05_06145 [Sphaerochaetaceae bacterium]|nr:hypothetical protein [Sphaerochaetaceae bacterium]
MRLFEWSAPPREYLGDGYVCVRVVINFFHEKGSMLVVVGEVEISHLNGKPPIRHVWMSRKDPESCWKVWKKDKARSEIPFFQSEEVNQSVKKFIAKQLKVFCFQYEEIEHDPANDFPLSCVRPSVNEVLAVQAVL